MRSMIFRYLTSVYKCAKMHAMNTLTITQAAAHLNRSVKTLQRYDREGLLVPTRTPKNRRVYTIEQLDAFLGQRREKKVPYCVIVYCRVSSVAQRPDLKNQRRTLEDFCASRGLAGVEFVEEIGGGLNFKRKKFNTIMDAVVRDEVKALVIAHQDRLCRFGFEWFERLCQQHGCEVLILNNESLSPEEEMVQDLMTIVHCFSLRLYGLRHYRKKLKEALQASAS